MARAQASIISHYIRQGKQFLAGLPGPSAHEQHSAHIPCVLMKANLSLSATFVVVGVRLQKAMHSSCLRQIANKLDQHATPNPGRAKISIVAVAGCAFSRCVGSMTRHSENTNDTQSW
jgi:hypothetical protein